LDEILHALAANPAPALERLPPAAAGGHVRAEFHSLNYNFSGLASNCATRASKRPAAPPSSTRWSKLSVTLASITGTNWPFAASQFGTRRAAPIPSTSVCSGNGIGVAHVNPKLPKFVTV